MQLTAEWCSIHNGRDRPRNSLPRELPHCSGFPSLISVITTGDGFPMFCSFRIICAAVLSEAPERNRRSHCQTEPANLEQRVSRLSNLSFVPPLYSTLSTKNPVADPACVRPARRSLSARFPVKNTERPAEKNHLDPRSRRKFH